MHWNFKAISLFLKESLKRRNFKQSKVSESATAFLSAVACVFNLTETSVSKTVMSPKNQNVQTSLSKKTFSRYA